MTEAVYDFLTELRTDTFSTSTAVGVTSANETLLEDLYDGDIGSVDIDSDLATDVPLGNSYNATSQVLLVTGLTDNTTRTLQINYDVNALEGFGAIVALIDRMPFIWIIIVFTFAPAALYAIFTGRS